MFEIDKQPDNLAITEYLLGSLPEAKAERFDELSLSDDEFSEALRAAEKDLVDAYVQGELSGSNLERFESFYLASPLRRKKVQIASAFQALGEATPFVQEKKIPKKKESDSTWLSAFGFSGVRLPSLRLVGALTALIVMILAGWLIFENLRLRRELSQTLAAQGNDERVRLEKELAQIREERDKLEGLLSQKEAEADGITKGSEPPKKQPGVPNGGLSVATFVLKPQLRSTGQIPTISIPDNATHITFRLELEPNDYSAYRVALLVNEQSLWQSATLKSSIRDSTQSLRVSVSTQQLKEGTYILRLSGISSNRSEIIGDYPVRVVK